MDTELYKRQEWKPHVRAFYSEWLDATGWRATTARTFDRFVATMEERIGDYLMDPCLDFSGMGLVRKDEETE